MVELLQNAWFISLANNWFWMTIINDIEIVNSSIQFRGKNIARVPGFSLIAIATRFEKTVDIYLDSRTVSIVFDGLVVAATTVHCNRLWHDDLPSREWSRHDSPKVFAIPTIALSTLLFKTVTRLRKTTSSLKLDRRPKPSNNLEWLLISLVFNEKEFFALEWVRVGRVADARTRNFMRRKRWARFKQGHDR